MESSSKKFLQNLKSQNRTQIIFSFWFVIILGLPIWWNSTKIQRKSLPQSDLKNWINLKPCPIRFPINLTTSTHQINLSSLQNEIQNLQSNQNINHQNIDISTARCLDFFIQFTPSSSKDLIILHRSQFDNLNHSENSTHQTNFPISLNSNNKPNQLLRLLAPLQATNSRVIKYSSQLKLVFSLMNEDITQPSFIRQWDIRHAIELYLEELLASLAPLHNFTCQTQILHHSPLAFEPTVVNNQISGNQTVHVVEENDLKAFINDADWNLASSVTMDPILHFVLWIPSPAHRPFKIRRNNGTFDVHGSFMRPQWGSAVIYNPPDAITSQSHPTLDITQLDLPMQIFRHHLLNLLGLVDNHQEPALYTLALDAIIRRRIIENTHESINSLQVTLKLVNDQTNMRVSAQVQNQFKGALKALKCTQDLLKPGGSLWKSLLCADESKTLSSMAFFSPTMLSLLYFPDEHKYAVYTPLFGPILIPLILSLIREWKNTKKMTRIQQKQKSE
ncbi:hypothetical protein O181_071470 [Austropuccinia psidii MF-1]|uniref:GPI transamidase component PIG-S n=1 Tax=Austropuccinia psidii MF-1 TaxID=1389203 RepID=A0A9Q3F6S7_9BASI|nr:hypothetical protein [Austropuccinia psidii MF-1]